MDNGSSWGRKEEEKRAERVLWPKEVRAHAHLYLSMHDTTTVASVMYEVRTKKRRFVRRINTGINVTDNIPTKECSFQPTYSLPYWQDTKNYRDDRATNSFVDDGGKRIGRTITKRFMKLTWWSRMIFLDLIFCLTPFNAIYSQFSLFPFCLSVLDCSLEISRCTSKIIRPARNASTKGTGVNGFINEQINNALIKQLTQWWEWKTGEQMNRNNVTGIIATTKNSKGLFEWGAWPRWFNA